MDHATRRLIRALVLVAVAVGLLGLVVDLAVGSGDPGVGLALGLTGLLALTWLDLWA